jgi:hypothetical protein
LRSIRVTKLPSAAQEPLIQQIFEKFGEIEAVLTEEAGEAVVVFKDTAVSQILLDRVLSDYPPGCRMLVVYCYIRSLFYMKAKR